jgi:hypothetical protein
LAELADLARQFATFAQRECGASPLYQQIAVGIASGEALLAIAAPGANGPKPNLFLAAVHYLLLSGIDHPLAQHYPSVARFALDSDPFPAFKRFCLEHREQIQAIVASHRVQTNEVARCAYLVPSIYHVSQRAAGRRLALIEVGSSAGLLLLYDSYGYDFGDGRQVGDVATLRIDCALGGPITPPLPTAFPAIANRVGIDLNPLDVRESAAMHWLRALVWPDQPERAERLRRAIDIARRHPPRLIPGDANQVLPSVLESIPADAVPCVIHAHTLNQFSPAERDRFDRVLTEHSIGRDVYRLSLEGKRPPHAQLELRHYARGVVQTEELLAQYDPHGGWLDWVSPSATS